MEYEFLITDPQNYRTWRAFLSHYQAGIYASLGYQVLQVWR